MCGVGVDIVGCVYEIIGGRGGMEMVVVGGDEIIILGGLWEGEGEWEGEWIVGDGGVGELDRMEGVEIVFLGVCMGFENMGIGDMGGEVREFKCCVWGGFGVGEING